VKVKFIKRENGPTNMVADVEVVFEDFEGFQLPGCAPTVQANPFRGMKLVGFSLWKDKQGEVYVTFPSRAFGASNERKFFDYLRVDTDTVTDTTKRHREVKQWILDAYKASLDPTEAP
jgi:hypothetical protein